mmetsp:Transcript_78809/g.189124  ORF Transcript_78809/g.189124 Transcript_78809/m.189124 type:complete len:207 (-) Transcript_78809:540-1160(-)
MGANLEAQPNRTIQVTDGGAEAIVHHQEGGQACSVAADQQNQDERQAQRNNAPSHRLGCELHLKGHQAEEGHEEARAKGFTMLHILELASLSLLEHCDEEGHGQGHYHSKPPEPRAQRSERLAQHGPKVSAEALVAAQRPHQHHGLRPKGQEGARVSSPGEHHHGAPADVNEAHAGGPRAKVKLGASWIDSRHVLPDSFWSFVQLM